jgi:hypothetical protein
VQSEYSDLQRSTIQFQSNRVYRLATLQLEYTTYDCRRAQDSIGVNGEHCDVFMAAGDSNDAAGNHPYWYARVLSIFHARVQYPGAADVNGDKMDFLFVRWFKHDSMGRAGWRRNASIASVSVGRTKINLGFLTRLKSFVPAI